MNRLLMFSVGLLACVPTLLLAQVPKETSKDGAKDAAKPGVAVSASPERTTASFGDWVMKCEMPAAPAKGVCEIGQAMTVQGQAAPIAQIALARASRSEPMRVVLVLPTNVTLTSLPKIFGDKDDKAPLELGWQRCVQGGCIAGAIVTDEALTRLAARSEPGIITFRDATERDLAIPLSLRGLAQANAAATKEQ